MGWGWGWGGVGGAVQKPSPGICLGSLLGSPQTRPGTTPPNLSGLSPAALPGLECMHPSSAECLGALFVEDWRECTSQPGPQSREGP